MERSFGSKYGKWIALTAVVLALVLWFVLSFHHTTKRNAFQANYNQRRANFKKFFFSR